MTRNQAILMARKMDAAGDFNRRIVERAPDTLRQDIVKLDCGHQLRLSATVVDLWQERETMACHKCSEEWLREHSEDGEQ